MSDRQMNNMSKMLNTSAIELGKTIKQKEVLEDKFNKCLAFIKDIHNKRFISPVTSKHWDGVIEQAKELLKEIEGD